MLALDGPMGPFKAVGNILGNKLLGPFGNIDTAFPCSGGPIQSSRKQTLLGPFMSVNTGFICSDWPIRSSWKHSRGETAGPIHERRCWLCMLWRAHSKQSETFSGEK